MPEARILRPRRNRLVLILLLCFGAVGATAVFLRSAYLEVETLAEGQYLAQEALIGRQTSYGIERDLDLLVRELQNLALDPAVRRIDPEGARRSMERAFAFLQELAVNDISRSDAHGTIRIALTSPQLVGQDFSFRDYFRRLRSRPSPGSAVFEFLTFRGFRRGEKGILVAVPVFDEAGTFAGPLVAILEVSRLLQRSLPPPAAGRRSWVVDADGILLHHPTLPVGTQLEEAPGGDEGWRSLLARLRTAEEFSARYHSADGKAILAAVSSVHVADAVWSVVIEEDAAAVEGNLTVFSNRLAAAASIALVTILGAAALLTDETARGATALRREVLERRRIERHLRQSEGTYRTLVEHAPS